MTQMSLLESMTFKDHKKYIDGVFKTKQEIEEELKAEGKTQIYHILSYGAGSQSSYLLEEHFKGNIHYDFIIMSDTGAEPDFIHDQIQWWLKRKDAYENDTPFFLTSNRNMKGGIEEMLFRYCFSDYQRFNMVMYCNKVDETTGEEIKGGLTPRGCTVDHKIVPVKQKAREEVMESLGLKPNQRMPKEVGFVIDIGFSLDEIRRINTYQSHQFKYMRLAYPLVEKNLTTIDVLQWLDDNSFPNKRSRCYLCPFNCDDSSSGMDWQEIIDTEPLSFLKACYFDETLREVQRTGKKALKSITYFHYSRRPLKDVYHEDYEWLYPFYKDELQKWIDEWKGYIKQTYAV